MREENKRKSRGDTVGLARIKHPEIKTIKIFSKNFKLLYWSLKPLFRQLFWRKNKRNFLKLNKIICLNWFSQNDRIPRPLWFLDSPFLLFLFKNLYAWSCNFEVIYLRRQVHFMQLAVLTPLEPLDSHILFQFNLFFGIHIWNCRFSIWTSRTVWKSINI